MHFSSFILKMKIYCVNDGENTFLYMVSRNAHRSRVSGGQFVNVNHKHQKYFYFDLTSSK